MQEEYWTTKEGKKMAVSDMTEEHVKNVLRMIIRNSEEAEMSEKERSKREQYCIEIDGLNEIGCEYDAWLHNRP